MADNPLIIDTEARLDPNTPQPKVLYSGDGWTGQPYIAVLEDTINISTGRQAGIAISDKFGITFGGSVSLSLMPDQVSIGGGYWRLNPLLLSCIPSTTPTPIPTLVKDVPRLLKAKSDLEAARDSLISQSDAAIN